MDEVLVALAPLFQCQHGIVSRCQAVDAGVTVRQIERRLQAGSLVACAPGVYRIVSSPITPRSCLWAAQLAVPGSVVSHRSAAHLFGLWRMAPVPELSLSVSRSPTIPGVIVHRRRPNLDRWSVTFEGLLVTRPEVTVLEMASTTGDRAFRHLVDDFVAGDVAALERLAEWFECVGGRGRKGSARARAELESRLGGDIAESRLERLFAEVINGASLPPATLQYSPTWAPRERVDVAFVGQRLLVELDGRRWHASTSAFESDRRRDQVTAAHGWRTIRITWRQLTDEPDRVISILKSALSAEL